MAKSSDPHLDDLTRRFVRQAPTREQHAASRTGSEESPRPSQRQGLILLAIFAFGLIAVGGLVGYLLLR